MSVRAMVREFHEVFGLGFAKADTPELRGLQQNLIEEEANEVWEALERCHDQRCGHSLQHVAKELADLVYVAYSAAISLGIDLDESVRRVHRSNMSKLGPDGRPIFREDGKVLKGPGYKEADMRGVVTAPRQVLRP